MRALLAAVVAMTIGFHGRAHAYCLQYFDIVEGYPVWTLAEIPYYVSDNIPDPAFEAAIDAAFGTWAQVPCISLKFKKMGTFTLDSVPFKNHGAAVYVYWHPDESSYPVEPSIVSYAYAFVEADEQGRGEITGGSIAINAFAMKWATDGATLDAYDLQGEMTERVGQVIGLETSNAYNTVMNRYLSHTDTSKRTLKQDDINAVTYLYGDETCTLTPPEPGANGCAPPPPDDAPPTPPDGSIGTTDGGLPDIGNINLNRRQCTTAAQCDPGEICTAEGVCMAGNTVNNTNDGTESGCSCSLQAAPPLSLLGLLAALLLLCRRRRGCRGRD